MIGRIIWWVALAIVGVISFAVQIDRQAAITPSLAEVVPPPFRGFAQARIATQALSSGSSELALEETRRLVDQRPIPAEALSLFAQARLESGDAEGGLLAIQYAAQRGWRDPAAQEAMLRLAVAAGDEAEAAKRYVALFLQSGTEDALLDEFGQGLFGSSDGPATQTLIEIVANAPRWQSTFLRRGSRTLPAMAFVTVIEQATTKGAQFDCAVLDQSAQLIANRDSEQGQKLSEIAGNAC